MNESETFSSDGGFNQNRSKSQHKRTLFCQRLIILQSPAQDYIKQSALINDIHARNKISSPPGITKLSKTKRKFTPTRVNGVYELDEE